jgi:hypothetical protein
MRPFVKINGKADEGGKIYRTCPKCERTKELDEFGLRTLKGAGSGGEDVITNQSWCRTCRAPRRS